MESNAFLRKETHLPIFTIIVFFVMWSSAATVASAGWVLKPSPIVSEGREAPRECEPGAGSVFYRQSLRGSRFSNLNNQNFQPSVINI